MSCRDEKEESEHMPSRTAFRRSSSCRIWCTRKKYRVQNASSDSSPGTVQHFPSAHTATDKGRKKNTNPGSPACSATPPHPHPTPAPLSPPHTPVAPVRPRAPTPQTAPPHAPP